jgi:hypothetical protein
MEGREKLSTEELASAGEPETAVPVQDSEPTDPVEVPIEKQSRGDATGEGHASVGATSEGAATAPTAAVASGTALTGGERAPATAGEPRAGGEPLLAQAELGRFRDEWEQIQVGFVDEPRGAVEQADLLVAELMQRLAATFSDERSRLEGQWDRGDEVSTEDLRVALTRYRSFFERLLSA